MSENYIVLILIGDNNIPSYLVIIIIIGHNIDGEYMKNE